MSNDDTSTTAAAGRVLSEGLGLAPEREAYPPYTQVTQRTTYTEAEFKAALAWERKQLLDGQERRMRQLFQDYFNAMGEASLWKMRAESLGWKA